MGPTQVPRNIQVEMAKKERAVLQGRIDITQQSIDILTTPAPEDRAKDGVYVMGHYLGAIINAQLLQLRANLEEGQARLAEIDGFIRQAETGLVGANVIPPANVRRRES